MKFDSTKKFDLILMGRIAVDFNPVDMFMPLDKSTTFKKYLGGSPANTAVGMARLGAKIGFIGTVSDDQLGKFVTDFFDAEGIDTSHVVKAKNGEKIGLTFTEILSHDESSILMYRNGVADLQLSVEDVDEDYIKSAKALLISGTALCQSPSREACFKAMRIAENNGIPIIFDIDYRAYNWTSFDEISIYYSFAAERATMIFGSSEEFELTQKLLGVGGSDEEIRNYWFSKRAELLVIKHGKKGSKAYTKSGEAYQVNIVPVEAIKSFGGGDGYASAFLAGFISKGYDVKKCLEMGTASASMLVASHACSLDMPNEETINAFVEKAMKEIGEFVIKE